MHSSFSGFAALCNWTTIVRLNPPLVISRPLPGPNPIRRMAYIPLKPSSPALLPPFWKSKKHSRPGEKSADVYEQTSRQLVNGPLMGTIRISPESRLSPSLGRSRFTPRPRKTVQRVSGVALQSYTGGFVALNLAPLEDLNSFTKTANAIWSIRTEVAKRK